MAGEATQALTISAVTKRFGAVTAVDGVSLSVAPGEMLGIIGRSGAGKSTLLRLINRLSEADSGEIRYGESDIRALKGAELRAWRRRCAMIFQQFHLVGRLDVLTNVLAGALNAAAPLPSLFKSFTKDDRARAILALDRLDMTDTVFQRAETLSGGQQQRVAIARALMQDPDIILADEPIASLDPVSAQRVMDALKAINEQDGRTVIANLHTLDTARRYCSRVVGLSKGVKVFDGPPGDLTPEVVAKIYGSENAVGESLTSTALSEPA